MSRPTIGRERYNVSLLPALVERLDAEAKRRDTTRSALLEAGAERVLGERAWLVSELDARGRTRATHEFRGSVELAQLRLHQFAAASPGGVKLYEVTSDGQRLREELRPARA